MDEQNEGVRPEDEDVEGHLLKEGVAAAAVAGAIFAGSAQARLIDPNPGSGGDAAQSAQTAPTAGQHKQKKTDHHQRQRNRADVEKDG
jgi:hypothetical protein